MAERHRHLRLEGSDELRAAEREAVVDVVREVVQRALGSLLRCGSRDFKKLPHTRHMPLPHKGGRHSPMRLKCLSMRAHAAGEQHRLIYAVEA